MDDRDASRSPDGSMEPGFERYLRPIFDNMFEGIQIIGFDWRYLYLNATAAKHGRRPREELVGRRMMDAYPGFEHTEVFKLLQRCMEERTAKSIVNEFVYDDGSRAWFSLRMDPVPMGVLLLSIDITAEKSVESQLREAQKLEAIGRLAGGVAHDFNNLLTVISGYSGLLLEELSGDDRFRIPLEEIHEAGRRGSALTRQLLAFSRRQPVQPELVELDAVLREMDRLIRRLIGEDVDLSLHLNAPGLRVLCASSQVEQVVMNLVVNARDAMPTGGKLTVQSALVDLDEAFTRSHAEARPGPHVMLAVSDTGTGMDSATRARIFEPFFTTKPHGKGTGLGLPTVYGIVKQAGGTIFVYSEPGRGTTFKVYLPLAEGGAPVRARPAASFTASGAGEVVLVVEDDDAVRRFIGKVLEAAGYVVLEAGTAEKAVALARQNRQGPHVLLVDVVLPGSGGRELAEQVLKVHPHTRIVFMSGYTDEAIAHRGGLEPSAVLVEKPIIADALLTRIRQVLVPSVQ